jgi:hypothetical protein
MNKPEDKHEHEHKHDPKHETKREGRADETDPPIGEGPPAPPFAEPSVPVEKVRVYGDASATYGSMIPPQAIHPYQEEIDEMTEPVRKEQAKKEEKRRKEEEPPPESKPDEPVYEKLRRYPGEGDVPEPREEDPHPGLYMEKKKEDKAPHAEGKAAEDERNKKREAKDDKPSAKGPHDR